MLLQYGEDANVSEKFKSVFTLIMQKKISEKESRP